MHRILIAVVVALVASAPMAHASQAAYSDRIAAVVNGDVILESEVKKHALPLMRRFSPLPFGVLPPGKWPTEKEILDELIVIRLLEQEAARRGLAITDKRLDEAVDALRQRNKLTQQQFVLSLAAQGLNYADFREIHKRQMVVGTLVNTEVVQKSPVTEEDAKRYFKDNRGEVDALHRKLLRSINPEPPAQEEKLPEIPTHEPLYVGGEVRLRQITLKVPPNAKAKDIEQIMATAKKVYTEAMTGGDFAKLAKEYSEDPSKARGGDLGYMKYNDMIPALQKVVQRMEEGDVTPPLKTGNAVIIFNLADAKNRKLKKVPIPEKTRKLLEKQIKDAQQKRAAQRRQALGEADDSVGESPAADPSPAADQTNRPPTKKGDKKAEPKDAVSLTPEEEKEYQKVRGKVFEILRLQRMQARMKEWVEELKKNSIIEVRL